MKEKKFKHIFAKKKKQKYFSAQKLKSIIISCEDSVSSPTYFNTFLDVLKSSGKITKDSLIIPHTGRTHPTGVLKSLLLYKSEDGKKFKDFDYRFIVIDRDKEKIHGAGHSKKDFNLAFKKAKRNKIKVIYANPSFELWYLLHFKKCLKPLDRIEVIDRLIEKLKLQHHSKFLHLASGNIKSAKMSKAIAKELKRSEDTAIQNAKYLVKFHKKKRKKLNPERDNPSTNIHKLIKLFNELAKSK